MQMQIDPKKLFQLFDECEAALDVERFHRIKHVYDEMFGSGDSTEIDFSSFTRQDVLDTLDDLSDYTSEDNQANSNNPDNIGVVLHEMDQGADVMRVIDELPPAKIPMEFF